MPRIKSNKEYAIRLIHPILGEYYYNYDNSGYWNNKHSFVFTQNLKSVSTWKTLKIVEKQIDNMHDFLNKNSGKILLYLGTSLNQELSNEIKEKTIFWRKRYYFPIYQFSPKNLIDKSVDNINRLDKTLIENSKKITKMIKKSLLTDDEFMMLFKSFQSDINLYTKEKSFLDKIDNNLDIKIDIVNASYNFRYLKIQTLNNFNSEEQIITQ